MGLGLPQGPRVGMVPGPNGSIGIQTVRNPPSDIALANPSSPQLDRLMNAALGGANPCAQAHLLGEFVHAFQDTYSHRDHENRPYDPVVDFLSLGLGHLRHMHDPDWTFNHINSIRPEPVMLPTGIGVIPRYETPDGSPRFSYVDWNVNEDRTLQMERDLHALLSKFGNPRDAVPFEMIEDTLREFNATQEWQRHGQADAVSFPRKLEMLEMELELIGYEIDSERVRFVSRGNSDATVPYRRGDAEANRTMAVCSLTSTVGTLPDKCPK